MNKFKIGDKVITQVCDSLDKFSVNFTGVIQDKANAWDWLVKMDYNGEEWLLDENEMDFQ